MLKCERRRYHSGWRSDIADKSEHPVLLVELLDGFGSPYGLVAVVYRNKTQHSPVRAAVVVRRAKRGLDAEPHLQSELSRRAREGRRHAKHDLAAGHAAHRVRWGFTLSARCLEYVGAALSIGRGGVLEAGELAA